MAPTNIVRVKGHQMSVTEPDFKPERVRRARDQVAHQIRNAILSNHFAEGQRLPTEAALARDFAVSRNTVREALRALAAEGLIATYPGAQGGSFVRTVDHNSLAVEFTGSVQNIIKLGSLDYNEVATVRILLEVPSAELAATHRTEVQVSRLDEIVAAESALEFQDPEVEALNAEFHRTIAQASGNRLLVALISALHEITKPVRFIAGSEEVGRDAVRAHIAIVRAIKAGDADAASQEMKTHLTHLGQHARDSLDS